MVKHIVKSFRTQNKKIYHFKQISQDDDYENNEFNFKEMIGIYLDTSALICLFTNDGIKKCIIKF